MGASACDGTLWHVLPCGVAASLAGAAHRRASALHCAPCCLASPLQLPDPATPVLVQVPDRQFTLLTAQVLLKSGSACAAACGVWRRHIAGWAWWAVAPCQAPRMRSTVQCLADAGMPIRNPRRCWRRSTTGLRCRRWRGGRRATASWGSAWSTSLQPQGKRVLQRGSVVHCALLPPCGLQRSSAPCIPATCSCINSACSGTFR